MTDARPELLTRIFDLRRTVAHLKRVATQEREVLIQMSRGDFPFISEKAQVYFKDIYDHLFRIVEGADNHRETLNVMVQVYVSMVSNQLNHTMRVSDAHRNADAAADRDHGNLRNELRFHAGASIGSLVIRWCSPDAGRERRHDHCTFAGETGFKPR